jgi:hypothetical protein
MKCFKHEFNTKYQPVLSVWAYAADPVQAAILAQGYVIRNKPLYDWKRFKQVPVENADISAAQAHMATTVRPRLLQKNEVAEPQTQASYLDNGEGGVDFFDAYCAKYLRPNEIQPTCAFVASAPDVAPQPDHTFSISVSVRPDGTEKWNAYESIRKSVDRARRAKGMAAFNALTDVELERAKAVLLAATGISADDPHAKVYLSASRQPDYVRISMGTSRRHTNMLRHWLMRHGIKYYTGESPTRVLACDLLPLLGYAVTLG